MLYLHYSSEKLVRVCYHRGTLQAQWHLLGLKMSQQELLTTKQHVSFSTLHFTVTLCVILMRNLNAGLKVPQCIATV